MSWFLSKCLRELKNTDYEFAVSFADTQYHEGTIYKASNWIDYGLCQPDYQYISDVGVPMHKKTLYNRAMRAGMKEREYAESYGYKKVKTGRKLKFVYPLSR